LTYLTLRLENGDEADVFADEFVPGAISC
jgi:hypothetical protein